MSKVTINLDTLVGIGDAIRAKKGTTEQIPVVNLASEIQSIQADTSTATMYSFNGTILPALPEWDKETYPYAIIVVGVLTSLYVSKNPILRDDFGFIYVSEYMQANCSNKEIWKEFLEPIEGGSQLVGPLLWSNHDIIATKDNSIYLFASEPIPIGEGGTEALDTLVKALMERQPYELKSNVEGVIANNAFFNNVYITSVNLPSVTSVGEHAFRSCSVLTSVNLPSATNIGLDAFFNCTALTSVNLPSATNIGLDAFSNCTALTSVNLPSATNIEEEAFFGCEVLKSVNIPSVTTIGRASFADCTALESVDLPSATSIGMVAFSACPNLTTVILRTTSTVCVAELSSFANTPLVQGTGHIYVPSVMYEYYRAGYEPAMEAAGYTGLFSIMFRKIEDYPEITGTN